MATIEGQYLASPPTLPDGSLSTLRVNENGELITASSGGGGGDASAANQVTEISKLTSIDGKVPSLGQALAAASVPVVLTAAQLTTLTPPAAITGFATSAKQDTAQTTLTNIETNTGTIAGKDFATRSNQNTEIASLASIDGKITAVNTGAVVVSSSALPTGASTSALQTSGNASLTSIDGKITACNTGAVTVSSSALPTGAATESTLSFISSQLSNIDTNTGLPLRQVSYFKNFGANATINVKSASGFVYGCSCLNLNAAARYFQLWNSSTTAGSGTLLCIFLVPPNSQLVIGNDYFDRNGITFDTGIAFGFSTTATTYTAGTAADQISTVIYS